MIFGLSFTLKAKAKSHAEVSSTKPQSSLLHALPSGSIPPSVPPQTAVLANAVRIERLSDDEDVDITDDLSDDTSQPENQLDFRDEPQDQRGEIQTAFSTGEPERQVEMSATSAEVVTEGNSSSCCQTVTEPEPGDHRESWCTKAQCQHDEEEEEEGVEGSS